MKQLIFQLFTWFQHQKLKAEGYRFGSNVIISKKGVRIIGGGKILVRIM